MLDLGRQNARKHFLHFADLNQSRLGRGVSTLFLTLILGCEIRLSLRRFNVDFLGCETIGEN